MQTRVCTHTCTLDVVHINRFVYMYVHSCMYTYTYIRVALCVVVIMLLWYFPQLLCCVAVFHLEDRRAFTDPFGFFVRHGCVCLMPAQAPLHQSSEESFNQHDVSPSIFTAVQVRHVHCACASLTANARERRQRELSSQCRSGQPSSATVSTGMHGFMLHAKSQCLLSRREGYTL